MQNAECSAHNLPPVCRSHAPSASASVSLRRSTRTSGNHPEEEAARRSRHVWLRLSLQRASGRERRGGGGRSGAAAGGGGRSGAARKNGRCCLACQLGSAAPRSSRPTRPVAAPAAAGGTAETRGSPLVDRKTPDGDGRPRKRAPASVVEEIVWREELRRSALGLCRRWWRTSWQRAARGDAPRRCPKRCLSSCCALERCTHCLFTLFKHS